VKNRSSRPSSTEIELIAADTLDQRELQLAERLAFILDDDNMDSGSLIEDILPIYWERVEDRLRNLSPSIIYRPLYYVHSYGGLRDFKGKTRTFMQSISGHLEGCLLCLTAPPPRYGSPPRPFGRLVGPLNNAGVLSDELANQLWRFNEAINVSSKHFNAYMPTVWLDERTFTVKEAACAFLLMRKLSIPLFALLQVNGVALPQSWPDFKTEWLSWSREIDRDPESNDLEIDSAEQ
jgi:hypothetical protein